MDLSRIDQKCAGNCGPDLSDTGDFATPEDATIAAQQGITVEQLRYNRAVEDAHQAMSELSGG